MNQPMTTYKVANETGEVTITFASNNLSDDDDLIVDVFVAIFSKDRQPVELKYETKEF